ncbi:MAG: penicillin acylase family protein [Kineosporiaceae bacterium]
MSPRERLQETTVRLLALRAVLGRPRPGTLRLAGPRSRVAIRRDGRGVPWVEADDPVDVAFGTGFVQACDRLWQMDVLRRRASGTLAEVVGPGALPGDVRAHRLALDRTAGRSLELLAGPDLAALSAFAAGVQEAAAMLRRRGALPVEFAVLGYRPRPWTPLDSVLIIKYLGFDLATNLRHEVFRERLAGERPQFVPAFAAPRYPAGAPVTVRRPAGPTSAPPVDRRTAGSHPAGSRPAGSHPAGSDPPGSRPVAAGHGSWREWSGGGDAPGSNAWALAGTRTASGAPVLANDPHVPFTTPSLWYQLGLVSRDEDATAYGVAVPGLPGLIAGANRHLAWGVTNATVDTQDLCLLHGAGARPTWTRETVVDVRGAPAVTVQAAGGERHVEIDDGAAGKRHGLFWSGLVPSTEIASCLGMWRSRDWAGLREQLRGFGAPVLNVVVAAADGTIALKTAGAVPRREPGSGAAPAPFDEVERSWRATIAFEDLPEIVNPAGGVIVSANHRLLPAGTAPFLGEDWAAPYRAERIEELVSGSGPVTPEDCARWQCDLADRRAARVLPTLLAALDQAPPAGPAAAGCHRLLREWDGTSRGEAAAPLVFLFLMHALVDRWVAGPLGADLAAAMPDLTLQVDALVLDDEARRAVDPDPLPVAAAAALAEAADRLCREHGADAARWRYDSVHRIDDAHPLAGVGTLGRTFGRPATPVGGSGHTVCLMTPDRTGRVVEGAPWRFVAELRPDGPLILDVLRHGSSGLPGSPHAGDQTGTHRRGHVRRVSLSPPRSRPLVLAPRRGGRGPGAPG